MTAKWVKFNGPVGSSEPNILSESQIELPSIDPELKGTFKVDLPENWQSADALYLRATDPHGHEIFTWSYPVQLPEELNSELLDFTPSSDIKTVKTENDITVSANKLEYTFSGKTNVLQQVKKDGKIIPLTNGQVILEHKDKN